jgi:outer membrane protein OmpA-like peptidoglycan-associated protein
MSHHFTSNRPGGKGSDDIYTFAKAEPAAPPAPAPPIEKPDTTYTRLPDPPPEEQPIRIVIYYDFDRWNIRNNAARDLDQLAAVLKEKPQVNIRLNAHTDARGNKAYNQRLSQKRAQSALDYLAGKGIDRSRMTAHGYGEERPVNDCTDGVHCSEAQHQQNRRTEFEVVGK